MDIALVADFGEVGWMESTRWVAHSRWPRPTPKIKQHGGMMMRNKAAGAVSFSTTRVVFSSLLVHDVLPRRATLTDTLKTRTNKPLPTNPFHYIFLFI